MPTSLVKKIGMKKLVFLKKKQDIKKLVCAIFFNMLLIKKKWLFIMTLKGLLVIKLFCIGKIDSVLN